MKHLRRRRGDAAGWERERENEPTDSGEDERFGFQ
jgi:hypothetical protein